MEDLELVSRELGVTAATLSGWRDDFLAGGQAALKSRPADDRDDEIARLRAKVGELTMDNELLLQRCRGPTALSPRGGGAVGQTVSPSTGSATAWPASAASGTCPARRSTTSRPGSAVPIEQRPEPKKRGPLGAASDEELVGHIRRILTESPFHGEGYRKVWARLRYQGIRTRRSGSGG